jgi:hypothetical protein
MENCSPGFRRYVSSWATLCSGTVRGFGTSGPLNSRTSNFKAIKGEIQMATKTMEIKENVSGSVAAETAKGSLSAYGKARSTIQ